MARTRRRSRKRFDSWAFPTSFLANLPATARTANLLPLRTPYRGTIVASDIVAGEVVDASKLLFTVADPRRMWLLLNVRQEDARYVAVGQTVEFRTDEQTQTIPGKVARGSAPRSTSGRALCRSASLWRTSATSQGQVLRHGSILLREEPHAVVVPRESVQSTGDAQFVFVRDKDYLKPGSQGVSRAASAHREPAMTNTSSFWPASCRARSSPRKEVRCCWLSSSAAISAPVAVVTNTESRSCFRALGATRSIATFALKTSIFDFGFWTSDDEFLEPRYRFLAAQSPAGDRRWRWPPPPRDCSRCGTWTSTPFPTRRRSRCRSTRSPRPSVRKRSSGRSPSRSSRRSADCRGLEQLRSISKFGLSQVVVTFEDGTDIYFARQLVNERLATVELPAGIGRPKMGPVATGLGEVFHYVVTGTGDDVDRAAHHPRLGHQARSCGRSRARPRSTAGAATRSSTRSASIPTRLIKHDLTFDEVVEAVQQEQPQRRRRQHPPGRRHAPGPGPRPHRRTSSRSGTSSSRAKDGVPIRVARRGRRGDRPRDPPRAPSRPTARARSCSAWASCSWARTATRSPGP